MIGLPLPDFYRFLSRENDFEKTDKKKSAEKHSIVFSRPVLLAATTALIAIDFADFYGISIAIFIGDKIDFNIADFRDILIQFRINIGTDSVGRQLLQTIDRLIQSHPQ